MLPLYLWQWGTNELSRRMLMATDSLHTMSLSLPHIWYGWQQHDTGNSKIGIFLYII